MCKGHICGAQLAKGTKEGGWMEGWKICRGQKYNSKNKTRKEQGGFGVRDENLGVLVLEIFIQR